MTPASAKAKGRRLQNEVRDLVKERYGFEPDTAVMGEKGKDVKDERLPYSIECKNVEKLNLWSAWQQAKDNLFEGDTPVVILTKNRSDTLAVVPVEWFLDRLEVREHGNVQPKASRATTDTTGGIPTGADSSGECSICRCLKAAGWVRPGTPKD